MKSWGTALFALTAAPAVLPPSDAFELCSSIIRAETYTAALYDDNTLFEVCLSLIAPRANLAVSACGAAAVAFPACKLRDLRLRLIVMKGFF